MNDHDQAQAAAPQKGYARELAELLNLLETVDRDITPEHVAQRFLELLDDIGDDGPHRERLAAYRIAEDHNGAAQTLTDLASAYLALAEAGAPADRAARQFLRAAGDSGDTDGQLDEWILGWLADSADLLIGQAPQIAAELLRQAVARSPAGSAQHDFLVGRLAEALYRVGNAAEAEQVAKRALAHAVDPDLLVDLHWTLAQCRMRGGRFDESLATLDQALASPGISARHQARLLVPAARTHWYRGDVEKAGQVAAAALEVALEADDNWAMGWALHVLTIVTGAQGHMTDALPLFERALTVTEADPALSDLRVLLQINMAVTLGNLDRYEEAISAAREALYLADQAGTVIRRVQAHTALAELLFDTGHWTEAMAEVEALSEDQKDPMAACCGLGIAAVICFHRGDITAARRHLAAAAPHAERTGSQVIGSLALARSLDREHAGDPAGALAVLTAGFAENAEEVDEIEDLLTDATRLAMHTGDVGIVKALVDYATILATEPDIPHRQATALYCSGLFGHDAAQLLEAAERYGNASRPLLAAAALEAAVGEFVHADDCGQARVAYTHAVKIYTSLGAADDVARLEARFRARGIHRGPHAKRRRASADWDSPTTTEAKISALVEGRRSNPRIAASKLLVS